MTALLMLGIVVVGCAGAFTFAGYVFGSLATDRRELFAASMTEHLQDANADFRKLAGMLLEEKRRSLAWAKRAARAEWRLGARKRSPLREQTRLGRHATWLLVAASDRRINGSHVGHLMEHLAQEREIAHREGRGVP